MRTSLSAALSLLTIAACGGSAGSLDTGPSGAAGPTTERPATGTGTEEEADRPADAGSAGDGSRDASLADGATAASGPCSLGPGAPLPAIVPPPAPSEWHIRANDLRGSLDPDPLRTKWNKDVSGVRIDVYPRGLDLGALEVTLGTCKLGPGGQVGQSTPGPSPQAPPTTEYGARFESVSFADPAWATFRFVRGARYVIEAKHLGAVVARLVFRVPNEFLALTTATRTNVTWTPPSTAEVGPDVTFSLVGLQMDATTHQTMAPNLQLSVTAGAATWDASAPTLDYALVWWPRKLTVQGLVRTAQSLHSATLDDWWYHAL